MSKKPVEKVKKLPITAKEVARLLKVSPEVVSYLREYEELPYIRDSKYILFSEPEVLRWRNRKLTTASKVVLNLKDYYNTIKLGRFITYPEFRAKVADIVFLDGDNLLQYVKRQNPCRDVHTLVGDIVHEFWDAKKVRCVDCGRELVAGNTDSRCCRCNKVHTGEILVRDMD